MNLVWEKSGENFHATIEDDIGQPVWHLIVEPIPTGGYDWAVWRPGEDPSRAAHGHAGTRHAAMWDAERAPRE
jgi:hypothetical protein